MSTFVNTGLISLSSRLFEVEVILDQAAKQVDKSDVVYNALCRSAQVLLIAHFEGYIKELVKNVLDDINYNSTFSDSRKDLKYTLCRHFILADSSGRHNQKKVEELMEVFDSLETKFKKEYFLHSDNKNPKESVLDAIAKKFGVKDIFTTLGRSILVLAFGNTNKANVAVVANWKELLLIDTQSYPYTIDLSVLGTTNTEQKVDDLWKAFIDDILKRRHDIAHGNEVDNSVSHTHISADLVKMHIFLLAFTLLICEQSNPTIELRSN